MHSVCLSIWGCQAVEEDIHIPSSLYSFLVNEAMNWDPRSETTFREAVEFPDVMEEESGCSFHCDHRVHRNEVHSFRDSIHDYHNGIVSRRLQELNHKIDTECIPLCI